MLRHLKVALSRFGGGAPEPSHDGHPAHWWLQRLVDNDASAHREAAAAFAAMGPAAIPALLDALADRAMEKRRARRLADGLAAIRPDGMQALLRALIADPQHPALVEAYHHTVRSHAEDLIPLLGAEDEATRKSAADWLSGEGARILPALLNHLAAESPRVRLGVIGILRRLLQQSIALPPEGVQGLIARVGDADAAVRVAAVEALGLLGEKGAPAVEPLRAGLRDENRNMREACIQTLGAIGPAAAAAFPDVLVFAGDSLAAARAAGSLAAGNLEAMATLRARLADPATRLAGAIGLAWAGEGGDAVLTALLDAAQDDKQDHAETAIEALGALGPAAAPTLPVLARLRREKPFDGALEWHLHDAIVRIKKHSR